MKRLAVTLALLALAGCHAPGARPPAADRPAKGLVALPCAGSGALAPANTGYCRLQRNYVAAKGLAVLQDATTAMQAKFPGARVLYLEASWPLGKRPMPPHLSHGDGREVDLAFYYVDRAGKPLAKPPRSWGYEAFEPPRREAERACAGGRRGKNDRPDPPRDRAWRLDEARTAALVKVLAADPRVRRIFIEPHLKTRLGLTTYGKVRFAGCQAARHDDHIHVDFF
ncbi:hypothetical protein QO010_004158 [Caulobacter ginsengisoli]|uniref:Extensin n=1 Tax=Caulobacter ginsengisoli TaxID=400775 RepID=A0ABU0IYD3_9CAUL|nr:hypothetical protein [Caulobacter ginsengisoli]MDQ0466365.1 hypothetical protein [Caulobacter ginsengisoli]